MNRAEYRAKSKANFDELSASLDRAYDKLVEEYNPSAILLLWAKWENFKLRRRALVFIREQEKILSPHFTTEAK